VAKIVGCVASAMRARALDCRSHVAAVMCDGRRSPLLTHVQPHSLIVPRQPHNLHPQLVAATCGHTFTAGRQNSLGSLSVAVKNLCTTGEGPSRAPNKITTKLRGM
jgi:hypothetical protein